MQWKNFSDAELFEVFACRGRQRLALTPMQLARVTRMLEGLRMEGVCGREDGEPAPVIRLRDELNVGVCAA